MMKAFLLTFALTFTGILLAEDLPPLPRPAELVVKNYQRDLAAIRDKALKDLQAIMNGETQRGSPKTAAAVQNAMEAINGGPLAAGTAGGAAPKSGKVTIKANEKLGAEIGRFGAGQSIKLEYVEGKWAMSGGGGLDPTKWLSPDDPNVFAANRLGIFAVENGQATKLAEVPAGTKKKAFRYRFERDYPTVILRILDADPADNPGFVIYNVEVIRGN